MALVGFEWLALAGVLAIIILFGPSKLPSWARSIGQAWRELNETRRELKNVPKLEGDG